ncbi:hypothetical protein [Candidatus Methylacidithermus pantelleriae]|uniref:Glycosyltransferase family 1 protein n=1 Tax=Candidatus Methylacidithermus pantelleriae TaxID=2744239 RepID=A0A8J2BVS6_9BACT|nr:hypothetical protein [Candidatus Methylacidithermus pantelleriae]CAF0703102.1 conserved hypothetical protein [Candidatus Methylacidithermus pantelleriae]
MRIVVTGLIAQYPFGGVIWDYLHYLLGFRGLGHEVWYLEDSGAWPYDPIAQTYVADGRRNAARLQEILQKFGLGCHWVYRDGSTNRYWGAGEEVARDLVRNADLLVNVSGAAYLAGYEQGGCLWVYLDQDPLFTQVRLLTDARAAEGVLRHHCHFTLGLCVGRSGCLVPEAGLVWRKTLPPVALECWPFATEPPQLGYTTIMNWASYLPCFWQGMSFGQKDREFWRFRELPRLSRRVLTIAMGQGIGKRRPTQLLQELGWEIVEPDCVVPDEEKYQAFIRLSLAEWSVAKEGYVRSSSGWFSGRTACYLASGRPAIVEDTGWSEELPSGEGLFAFRTLEDCVGAMEAVESDYDSHRQKARVIAENYFEARRVCQELILEAGRPV